MSDAPAGPTRAGIVAVLGAPNVGKSTLVNRIVGTKVSIVSPKAQTTRMRVRGICMAGASQIVFVDTPGVFAPRRRLDRAMVAAAWGEAAEADRVLLLVDSATGVDGDTRRIIERLKGEGRRNVVLVLNKIDLVKKSDLLPLAETLKGEGILSDIFMVSATTGDGIDDLVGFLARHIPEGPWLFPADQVSDMPERLLAAEITREQLYRQLEQELPYKAAVETERWQEQGDGSVRIDQAIFVEKPSQKAIVLGKGGARVKAIGAAARQELEALLGCRVHLFLFVKVREAWSEDRERYRELGLDFDA
jgi:GTP-binding protein Era